MYERIQGPRIQGSPRSILLLGPRQVGKSTLLSSLGPDLRLNLAHPATFRDYVTQPERLARELAAVDASVRTVFLDEVQRVPALLDLVQVLIDQQPRRYRFLLSGSSARKVRRGQANLLPGRIHLHYLHPLLATELGSRFDLDGALAFGGLPGVVSEPDPKQRAADLRAYTDVYLREEVQAEALVRDIGGYARLLDHVAAASGTILSLNKLCRQASIRYETARRYIEILEDTLLTFRIPAFLGSTRASLVAHPKIYLFDLGVRNALLHRPLDRPLESERGLLLEHLVAQELHARLGTPWPELELFHFRTKQGLEIDFLLRIGQETWAIEVQSARNLSPSMLTPLRRVGDYVPNLRRRILLFLGDHPQQVDDIEVLPLPSFLATLPR